MFFKIIMFTNNYELPYEQNSSQLKTATNIEAHNNILVAMKTIKMSAMITKSKTENTAQ